MIQGIVAPHRDCLADQLDSSIITADLMGKNAQQMQAVGMADVKRQYLPVKLLGFSQPAGLMMPQSFPEQSLNSRAGIICSGPGPALIRPPLFTVH